MGLSWEPERRCAEKARRMMLVDPLGKWLVPVPRPLASQSMGGSEEGAAMRPLGEATVQWRQLFGEPRGRSVQGAAVALVGERVRT